MEILLALMQLLKSEIIKELSLNGHSLGTLHQGDDLMKSSSKYLFVMKESPKYLENPFRRITFVCMHILGLQLIKYFIQFRIYESFDSGNKKEITAHKFFKDNYYPYILW